MIKPFIDFLTITQPISREIELNDGYVVVTNGEEERLFTTTRYLSHEGSHTSNVQVRAADGKLDISGNPSRWNRADNVYGLTYSEALEVFDGILTDLGLPNLDRATARVTRMDVTNNYAFRDMANAKTYLRVLQSMHAKSNRVGDTITIGNADYRRVTIYPKSTEIRNKAKREKDDSLYLEQLAEHCALQGMLRIEQRFGHHYWSRKGAKYWRHNSNKLATLKNLNDGEIQSMYDENINEVVKEIDTECFDELSANYLGTLSMWLAGLRPKERMSRSKFYVHRKAIKDATGYDIADDNIRRIERRVVTLHCAVAQPPDWYRYQERDRRAKG